MNARRIFILAMCVLFALCSAFADDLKSLRQLGEQTLTAFEEHHDAEGRRLFQQFLKQVNDSDSALRDTQIEVIIGVLGCAVGDKEMGRAALDYVLANGKGIKQVRSTLVQVRDACKGTVALAVPTAATMKVVLVSASGGPGVSGKGGSSFTPVPSLTLSPIAPAELEKRLSETEDPATALKPVMARYLSNGGGHGTVTDHFIVASDGSQSYADGVAACLERYRTILGHDFDMVAPAHRITVYNSQWSDRVYDEARHLHGIDLPPGTIAYSVYADLSMVGEGAPNGCGSLAHELVHLMIRSNFADAPAWLEEGLASAVALSVPEGDHLSFRPGWRDEALSRRWELRPSVARLLSLTWDDFSPSGESGIQPVVAIQAMASLFARYLAAHNKLEQVYFAVRKQDLRSGLNKDVLSGKNKDARSGRNKDQRAESGNQVARRQIVEKALGRSLEEVDADFAAWFEKQSSHEPTFSREEAGVTCTPPLNEAASPVANVAANAAADEPADNAPADNAPNTVSNAAANAPMNAQMKHAPTANASANAPAQSMADMVRQGPPPCPKKSE